ncbi:MAG: hypothetical protein CFH19_00431 [Alphaproteobacteria bacterium MarineAlpha5_Bin9]|nr:MAG: hypothetical protein CFH19_00431 [Alphaproteobacteria bacterium MarineAlpha5_Bin9]|tara:strand:+ start:1373 stop:2299 length:927 start_codon:yes stop_codon:yes gene_type:complete
MPEIKKILIIKHGSLGDICLSFEAFASVRKFYKKAKISILTEEKYFKLFLKSKYTNYLIIDNRSNIFESFSLLLKISKEKFDLIIDFQNSNRTSIYNLFFRFFSNAKICSSRPFAHYRYFIPMQGKERIINGLRNQLKLLGIAKKISLNYFWLKTKIKKTSNKKIALFIPGVSKNGKTKQWDPKKYAEVANFLEKLNYGIYLVGTKNDYASLLPIINSCKKVTNLMDKSPPEIIYSLALKSKIIFSNDTGPGHIASLAKKNFIWIINDNKISKANQPIGKHIYILKSKSINNISSQKVINFIKKNKLI